MKDINMKSLINIFIILIIIDTLFTFFCKLFLKLDFNILYFGITILFFSLLLGFFIFFILYKNFRDIIIDIKNDLNLISKGKLKKSDFSYEGADIIKLTKSLTILKENLTTIINQIELSAMDISGNAGTLSMFSDHMSNRLKQEKENIGKITENMKKLKENAIYINNFSEEALNLSKKNRKEIDLSIEIIKKLIDSMEEISKSSESIVEIAEFISEVADETNLLALNATIEASRAGAEGAGFSIVASEIRDLSEKSAAAIKNISATVENIVKSVKKGSEYSQKANEAMNKMIESVNEISTKIEEIGNNISNQSNITDSIHEEIEGINGFINENNALIMDMIKAIHGLSEQSNVLKSLLTKFEYEANSSEITNNIFGVKVKEDSVDEVNE